MPDKDIKVTKKELLIKFNELVEIVDNLKWEITYLKSDIKKLKENKQ